MVHRGEVMNEWQVMVEAEVVQIEIDRQVQYLGTQVLLGGNTAQYVGAVGRCCRGCRCCRCCRQMLKVLQIGAVSAEARCCSREAHSTLKDGVCPGRPRLQARARAGSLGHLGTSWRSLGQLTAACLALLLLVLAILLVLLVPVVC